MMIEKGPINGISNKVAEQYAEFFRQEEHLYTQALPIDLLHKLFSFCDRVTLKQATEALPRFKWIYDNKVEVYKSLIGRYFPFLQRTQPTEFEENPQELFLETIRKISRFASSHVSRGDILDALDGNDAKIKAKYAPKTQSFFVKIHSFIVTMIYAISSFWGARRRDNLNPRNLEDARNLDFLNVLLAYKKYLITHTLNTKSFSREQIQDLRKIALFFGNLDLLKVIVQPHYSYDKLIFIRMFRDSILYGHTEILEWILDNLEDYEIGFRLALDDFTFFIILDETIHVEALKIIISRYSPPQGKLDSLLLNNAGMKSGYANIEYMFSLSKDLCSFSSKVYIQALKIAFMRNHMKIVDFLLSKDEYADTLITHHLDPKLAEYIFKKNQEKSKPILEMCKQDPQKRKFEENKEYHSDPALIRALKKSGK